MPARNFFATLAFLYKYGMIEKTNIKECKCYAF